MHLRYHANPYFVGREASLNDIHEKLFAIPSAVLMQGHVAAVTALGGVGKTTLARQYVEKFWRCYRQVFWVDCRRGIESEFAVIHDILRPEAQYSEFQDSDKAIWARAELHQSERAMRLLIIDNAEDEESVAPWIPTTGNCHTIVTSRFAHWSPGIETCPIWVLEPGPARTLLLRRAGRAQADSESADCDALAQKLEFLPLALEQAAAYVAEQGPGYRFADYMRLSATHENEWKMLARATAGSTEYPEPVFLTWRTTIDKLPLGARAILRLCSFLAPTPIPTDMLIKGFGIVLKEAGITGAVRRALRAILGRERSSELEVREWKSVLARYSMIRLTVDDSFAIHRLVQAVERHRAPSKEQRRKIERAVDLLMAWAPTPSHEFKNWSAWKIARPHAQRLWELQQTDSTVKTSPVFLLQYGTFLVSQAVYSLAEPILVCARQVSERMLGVEHPDTLASVNNVAALYESQGRYTEAEPLYQRTLHDSERLLGPGHPSTIVSVNNLAQLYFSQGRYIEAEPLYTRALRHNEQVLGTEDPQTLLSVNNLAALYESQGRYTEAEPLYQSALLERERVLGAEHPDTLASVNDLAMLYNRQGRYADAEPLCQRAAEGRERVLGDEHPSTFVSVNNLAYLYDAQGLGSAAESLFQRSLSGRERVLGTEHPHTLIAVVNLAAVYEGQERYAEAERLYERSLRGQERVLGTQHPNTLISVNNLAGLYKKQGRYAEAEPLYQRALRDRERVLGYEHPDTLLSMNGLADLLSKSGRNEEANALRLEHGRRLINRNDVTPLQLREVGLTFYREGEYTEAADLLLRVLKEGCQIPSSHIHLARILIMLDRLEEAREEVAQARVHVGEGLPYLFQRILYFETLFEMLDGRPQDESLRSIAFELSRPEAAMEWDLSKVLEHLRPSLTEEDSSLLIALSRAINDRKAMPELEALPAWRRAVLDD
jgi:tetratricopeptide (TPR) repeat protein